MKPAIYVRESVSIPYATAIVKGIKPIETRTKDVLGRFVGANVLIIRTRNGHPAEIVGSVTITGKRFVSASEMDSDSMRNKTLIPPGSKFDHHGRGKWCYSLENAVQYSKPIPLSYYTIEHKTRSWAMLSA